MLQRFNDKSAVLPERILLTLVQHQQVSHLVLPLTLTLAPPSIPFHLHHTPQEEAALAASLYKLGIRNVNLFCSCSAFVAGDSLKARK